MTGMITSIPVAAAVAILPPVVASATGVNPEIITALIKESPLVGVLLWFMLSHSKTMNTMSVQLKAMSGALDRSTRSSMLMVISNKNLPESHHEQAKEIIRDTENAQSSNLD